MAEASQNMARVNASSNRHLEFPIFVDQEENGPATASGAGMEPTGHEETIFEVARRPQGLSSNDRPSEPQEWSKFIWESIYNNTPPLNDGDYFVLPILDAWAPFVSPAVLSRTHQLLDPIVRITIRGAERSKFRLLAVSLSKHADPTSIQQLNHLVDTWSEVRKWHEHMLEDRVRYTLDEFFQESLLHNLATKIFGSRE
jgi:hypothetical protein